MGETIIGASVIISGTTTGTVTDFDGNFELEANQGEDIQISYVGYKTKTVKAQPNIIVELDEDAEALEEVIVIGYGVQKKSVVTAAIARVSEADLEKTSPVRVDNALKGLAAGVTVTSASGQPGEGSRIRIRGVGTINNSDPLYIVDGMPIEGGIDYLNPNDIASIEVLKDAASGAIYGARAANGVILVTTKKGSEGNVKVTYDYSYSLQNAWKQRDMLNATEYALLMNEGSLNAGKAAIYSDPYSFGTGTNWQDEVFNSNAPMQNHQVSVSSATDKTNYFLSFGYFTQDGIVGGNYDRYNYSRMTLRSNITNYLLNDKSRNWLNKIQIGMNASYAHITSKSL